ncbi:hypothetical protein [Fodinicola acaciae]|uniref:hypothetical protein n=1 Tax=Fodinicola acaciae TaxID=2681555 RepID=UPI0013D090E1|nr:hypothetical protein [Fodinicola acaciae]
MAAVTENLPLLIEAAIARLERHLPFADAGETTCRRCGEPWKCDAHLQAELVVTEAGLPLADFDICQPKPQPLPKPVTVDTTQPRPKSHRRSPQPQQRLQLPSGASLTITPVGTAASRLPRIRPQPKTAADEEEG